MSLEDRHRTVSVRGLVVPTEWDSHGNAMRVSVFTFDDDEFEIAPQGKGEQLLGRAGQEVVLWGHLVSGSRRAKVLNVTELTVFDSEAVDSQDTNGEPFYWI